jgi:hypothetical protein
MIDERDTAILEKRQAEFLKNDKPKQGDFIRFADGTLRRVTHVWTENNKPELCQTNENASDGSFYLGNGFMSYSGGLLSGVQADTLTRTQEIIKGAAWFFHHDFATAGGGVYITVDCPVWECSERAEKIPVFYLTVLDAAMHERTCGYWYTITKRSTAHTAFATRRELENWLSTNNLKLTAPLTELGQYSGQYLDS